MDIEFYCFKCGQHLVVDAAGAGQSVNCPKCQSELVIPPIQADTKKENVRQTLPGTPPTPAYSDGYLAGNPFSVNPPTSELGPIPTTVPPNTQKPKRRIGKALVMVGMVFAGIAIVFVVLTANRRSLSPASFLEKKANTLNGSYSTRPIYPPERSNLHRTVVIQDPPYTCSLDFSNDGTVLAACKGHIYNRGTYQIIDRKIHFVWVDTNQQPAEAEMQGDVIFWRNGRYERK